MPKGQRLARWASLAILGTSIYVSGCKDSTKVDETPNEVGVSAVLPLTGSYASIGQSESMGIQLAIEALGDVAPTISLDLQDSQGKPDQAVSATRSELDLKGRRVFILSTTGTNLAVLPMLKESGSEVLAFAQCLLPGITEDYPFAYRVYANADEETDVLSRYCADSGYQRVGVLYVQGQIGEQAYQYFSAKTKALGVDASSSVTFDTKEKDFRTQLGRLSSQGLDAILIYGYTVHNGLIMQQVREMGIDVPILSNITASYTDAQDRVQTSLLEGVAFPAVRFTLEPDAPKVKAFTDRFAERGLRADVDSAFFYDLTMILGSAIREAKSGDPRAIEAAMRALVPYEGVTGTIDFGEGRDTRVSMQMATIRDGAIEPLN